MAKLIYTGGLSRVVAPWFPQPEVMRGVEVEAPDADAAILVAQEGGPWKYAPEPVTASAAPTPETILPAPIVAAPPSEV